MLPLRRDTWLCLLLGVLILGWLSVRDLHLAGSLWKRPCRSSSSNRSISRNARLSGQPPPDMPPLTSGENAKRWPISLQRECQRTDSANGFDARDGYPHADQSDVAAEHQIWMPPDVTPHVDRT